MAGKTDTHTVLGLTSDMGFPKGSILTGKKIAEWVVSNDIRAVALADPTMYGIQKVYSVISHDKLKLIIGDMLYCEIKPKRMQSGGQDDEESEEETVYQCIAKKIRPVPEKRPDILLKLGRITEWETVNEMLKPYRTDDAGHRVFVQTEMPDARYRTAFKVKGKAAILHKSKGLPTSYLS